MLSQCSFESNVDLHLIRCHLFLVIPVLVFLFFVRFAGLAHSNDHSKMIFYAQMFFFLLFCFSPYFKHERLTTLTVSWPYEMCVWFGLKNELVKRWPVQGTFCKCSIIVVDAMIYCLARVSSMLSLATAKKKRTKALISVKEMKTIECMNTAQNRMNDRKKRKTKCLKRNHTIWLIRTINKCI